MAKNSKIIFKTLSIIFLVLIVKCASQLPPGGGEVDKIPPTIVEQFPLNGTVNFKEDYFEITFSEYVDKRSTQEAIFISPALQKPLKFDWSGRTLTVYFTDSLKSNTTYTVSIGTDVRDIHNSNKMSEAFTFAFSTGEKIDKGEITGKVYNERLDGVMIFAYKYNGKEIDPGKTKPDYISQVGTNGKYDLPGIGDGDYFLFAVRDKFRDMLYQKTEDEFGVQSKSIVLSEKNKKIENVDFFLTADDTVAPAILNIFTKDRNHLSVTFNKKVDSTKIDASNFYLFDSTSNKKVQPKYFYKGNASANQFNLAFTDTMEKSNDWLLVANNIVDMNSNLTKEEKISIVPKTLPDTFKVALEKVVGTLPDGKADYDKPEVIVIFNDAIDLETIKNKLSIKDSKGLELKYDIKRIDDASFLIEPAQKLKQSSEYSVALDLKNYSDVFGNKVDSLFKNKFTTSGELDFSGASGTVSSKDTLQTIVVLESASQPKKVYEQKVNSGNEFDFKKVIPGKYLAWSYKDKNKNGKYDYGTIRPFKLSEGFRYYPDTLNLRARWPVGNINIDFGY